MCYGCPLVASIAGTSYADGQFRRGAAVTIYGSASEPLSSHGYPCNTAGGYTYAWSVTANSVPVTLGPASLAYTATLYVPPVTFMPDALVQFALLVCYTGVPASLLPSTCGRANTSATVFALSVLPALTGGNCITGERTVTLDASRSSDPDGNPALPLAFAWSCADAAGNGCLAPDGSPAALVPGAARQSLLLRGDAAGAVYSIVLTVSSTDGSPRPASLETTVTVFPGNGPVVAIQAPPAQALNPAKKLSLAGRVTSTAPSDSVTTSWALLSGALAGGAASLASPGVALTDLSLPSLVLAPGALLPASLYTFELTATDAFGQGSAQVQVSTARGPHGSAAGATLGNLLVSPSNGSAMTTDFTLTADSWATSSPPLSYQFSYTTVVNGVAAPAVVRCASAAAACARLQFSARTRRAAGAHAV